MKLYFTMQAIPGLENQSIGERLTLVQKASAKLTPPEKLLLNIIKLAILIPIFVILLRAPDNWSNLWWILVVILAYPFILKPVRFALIAKHIQPSQKEI